MLNSIIPNKKVLENVLLKRVRNKVSLIKQNPKIYAIRYDNVRTSVLDVFPFIMHYTIDDKQKAVIISAILHTRRNPDIWKERK